jgi:hypothetical protein
VLRAGVGAPVGPRAFRPVVAPGYGRHMTALRLLGRVLMRILYVLGKGRMVDDGQNPANGDPMGFDRPREYRP